jgi:hypothetical protein
VVSLVISLQNVHIQGDDDKKGKKKMEKIKCYKKKGGKAHMGREWDSDDSSTELHHHRQQGTSLPQRRP